MGSLLTFPKEEASNDGGKIDGSLVMSGYVE